MDYQPGENINIDFLKSYVCFSKYLQGLQGTNNDLYVVMLIVKIYISHVCGKTLSVKGAISSINLHGPTAYKRIDLLEKQGFIIREQSTSDKRVKLLVPTDRLFSTIERALKFSYEDVE